MMHVVWRLNDTETEDKRNRGAWMKTDLTVWARDCCAAAPFFFITMHAFFWGTNATEKEDKKKQDLLSRSAVFFNNDTCVFEL